jgi:hypothetical protein
MTIAMPAESVAIHEIEVRLEAARTNAHYAVLGFLDQDATLEAIAGLLAAAAQHLKVFA